MNNVQILESFTQAQAILKGHFLLSSGLHSDTYIQCAKLLQYPDKAEFICKTLANKINDNALNIDLVV